MPALEVGCGRNRDPRCDTFADANPNVFTREDNPKPSIWPLGDDVTGCWVVDVGGSLPWADATFDLIVARDILEHLPYRRTAAAIAEWARILKPGGRLYVQVPDCGEVMHRYATQPFAFRSDDRLPADLAPLPPILEVAWRVLGGQDDGVITFEGDDPALNLHLAMFDQQALRWYVERAGLLVESCVTNVHPNLLMWATKPT